MTRRTLTVVLSIVLFSTLLCTGARAEPLSDNGEHDIAALLDEADDTFDIEAEDAVILLHQERRLWTADGRRVRELHRIVWINTARGIRSYADLRVPWDSANQTLTATTLRSWRPTDQRWTASGTTAVVETTPYALGHAVAYSNVRETMLLHDGVELPCILETRYRIEDTEAFAGGMEGMHTMAQGDPVLISELTLGAPAGQVLVIETEGLDAAIESTSGTGDLHLWTYRSRAIEPLPRPRPAVAEVTHVAWSTWASHQALGNELNARFDIAAELDDASRAAAAKATDEARSPIERAELLAAWVGEATAFVDYDREWFVQPRPAHQTWFTAYAHALDRTVLAAAAFREAGLFAGLAFRRPFGVTLPEEVAGVTPLEGPLLWVRGEGFEGIYDPADSSLAVGATDLSEGRLWRLGNAPEASTAGIADSAVLRLDLEWNKEDSTWQGTGMLRANGALSPFSRMQGLEAGRSLKVLEGLAASVLEGAEVSALNFERFAPDAVHAGFALTVKAGERDTQDRLRLQVGDPAPALNDPFHDVAHLYEATRGSTLHLTSPLELVVDVHLEIPGLVAVFLPDPIEIKNRVGTFRLEVEQCEETISLRRTVNIEKEEVAGAQWSDLRALLLAATNPRNRTTLLK